MTSGTTTRHADFVVIGLGAAAKDPELAETYGL